MDKFGRTELPLRIQKDTRRRVNRIDNTIKTLLERLDNQDRDHKESLKRLASQLFYWIKVAQSTKPSTMIQTDITYTEENYIDWTKVFEGHLQNER